jgi:hypothetical protein
MDLKMCGVKQLRHASEQRYCTSVENMSFRIIMFIHCYFAV